MLDRIGSIAIERGPMPTMKVSQGRRTSERTLQVRSAIEKMPPDSWFVVPETGMLNPNDVVKAKKNAQFAGSIRKFIKDSVGKEWAVGVAVGVRAADGALIVRKTADITATKRARAVPA